MKPRPDIYIAGRFEAKERLAIERDRIHALGLGDVISTWLDEETTNEQGALAKEDAVRYARRDDWQVRAADLLILDTFDEDDRGGREVEYGIALAEGVETWVVGPRRNIFHQLAWATSSWAEVLEALIVDANCERQAALWQVYNR